MKVAFLTLGCKLNYAETSTYERGFRAAGAEIVPYTETADVYVVNTCTVTSVSDRKSRNFIRRVHRINPEAQIIVTGCSAELNRKEIEAIEGVSRVFGAEEKALVVPQTLGIPTGKELKNIFGAYSTGERTRSFLKVQDGCDNFCSYCAIPFARGRSRNIPIAECVENAKKIAAEGVKEIVLTGVNTGDFGRSTNESFPDLLKALNEIEGIERYRISSIEPNLLSEEILAWIAGGSKFQRHFHIPLQSGSDEILRKMHRHYDTRFFFDKIARVRELIEKENEPKVFFGIDLMVGMPGETEKMFEESLAFLKSIAPAFIHVFPFSKRSGTLAASMDGQVQDSEKKRRVQEVEKLCAQLHEDFIARNKGLREKVLFESTNHKGFMEGYTGNYIRVSRPYDAQAVGQIVEVTL